ncbi:MAG: MFS transporter [Burkholderiaceae bacterium]|nr:MFS transporter [Burkholderiaceae bacterium]
MNFLARRVAVWVFLPFAAAYFLAALLRAVTATLAPTLAEAFGLGAADLGLLSGGYFLGFALTQLPLGHWLDRHGPRHVLLAFLGVAVLGCGVFALATGFGALLAGRLLFGAGVSACLMAPLTGYRRWFGPAAQLRANAWMLMTGSLGMVASTLPVQWLLPVWGWRALFWAIAALLLLAGAWIALAVPRWSTGAQASGTLPASAPAEGYREVWRHAYFRRLAPMGFFTYGGMIAMQTLWAGPWMQRVAGYNELQAATGLFWINVSMLCTFWGWGLLGPWMARHAVDVNRVMAWGLPLSLCILLAILRLGAQAGAAAWALYCISCTVMSLSLPAVAAAFDARLAGRALSAFNLVVFAGVFVLQWGIGLAVDGFVAAGLDLLGAFRAALGGYLACNLFAWLWFLRKPGQP